MKADEYALQCATALRVSACTLREIANQHEQAADFIEAERKRIELLKAANRATSLVLEDVKALLEDAEGTDVLDKIARLVGNTKQETAA